MAQIWLYITKTKGVLTLSSVVPFCAKAHCHPPNSTAGPHSHCSMRTRAWARLLLLIMSSLRENMTGFVPLFRYGTLTFIDVLIMQHGN